MKCYLYAVARYKREENGDLTFVEYGAPFVDWNDDHVRFMVKQAIAEQKDKLDLSLFSVYKIASFYPDDESDPVCGQDVPAVIIQDCSELFKEEVKKDECE